MSNDTYALVFFLTKMGFDRRVINKYIKPAIQNIMEVGYLAWCGLVNTYGVSASSFIINSFYDVQ